MKAIIHVGAHKTGTTALQLALWKGRATLRERGIDYPEHGIPGGHLVGHHELAWAIDGDKTARYELFNGLRSAVRANRRAGIQLMIFSSEEFGRRATNGEGIRQLADIFAKERIETNILLYVRDQVSLLQALYFTDCFYYRETRDFLEWWTPETYDYEPIVQRWLEAFGADALIVRPYQRDRLVGGDIVSDLASVIDTQFMLDLPVLSAEYVNTSYPGHTMYIFQYLNRQNASDRTLERLRNLCHEVYRDYRSGTRFLSPALEQRILAQYSASNGRLADAYLGGSSDWAEPPTSHWASYREYDSEDAVARLLVDIADSALWRAK